ncbi:NAD(P)H-hydrate dehydratase [Variovorax sp. PCZ-1]|uniref:NAD(P)H-hydrate dehydratase n=1 Tax=Variovorax sp. PCZ-1 TaxID=2835533 RepID=UPI001BCDB070|nr:NAD(P)H-hydrate dehydratase [Variovorax sp. PCZ-1]MBS7807751.1 NAD(P)H-hydrate dehydratase [Variovorax sp. PCZ-1]
MGLERISFHTTQALHSIAATREIEQAAASHLPAHTLMQRAGLSAARLVCAIAPHARVIWIACGAGNNGGDGLEAAMHLRMWGRDAVVTWAGDDANCPPDALASLHRARDAGVLFADAPPVHWDAAIDALLGIGASRAPEGEMVEWLALIHESGKPVLQVDVPSGFCADTGQWLPDAIHSIAARADSMPANGQFDSKKYTLSLLTLKPGLFTAHGRDACGEIWFDDLGISHAVNDPQAWLLGEREMLASPRMHASHKGSYGDVAVIGGASGMQGAALLAARAALHAGAGRVFVGLLGGGMVVDPMQPELMFRDVASLDLAGKTVVCGCGGGEEVRRVLPRVLSSSERLVLDADALNAIATDESLQTLLKARAAKNLLTILTPHPLEAARLLGSSTAEVQAHRLFAAQTLADRFACTVILKGSGSIIASSGVAPSINPTGDARLATAGTGDVLAGICGAFLAQSGADALLAAQRATWVHGALVGEATTSQVVPASELIKRISQR